VRSLTDPEFGVAEQLDSGWLKCEEIHQRAMKTATLAATAFHSIRLEGLNGPWEWMPIRQTVNDGSKETRFPSGLLHSIGGGASPVSICPAELHTARGWGRSYSEHRQ
jgi:hypothetical protein